MKFKRSLQGRRVAALAVDGFEMVELLIPLAALRSAGAHVDVISLRRGRIRGVNLHEPARRVRVTKTLAEADASDYDALLIPGGFINPDLLRQSEEARSLYAVSTLCIGRSPRSAMARGCCPRQASHLAGAFVRGMLELFSGAEAASDSATQRMNSSPQRSSPPKLVINTMRWLPRPSIRVAAIIGIVCIWALRRAGVGTAFGR